MFESKPPEVGLGICHLILKTIMEVFELVSFLGKILNLCPGLMHFKLHPFDLIPEGLIGLLVVTYFGLLVQNFGHVIFPSHFR